MWVAGVPGLQGCRFGGLRAEAVGFRAAGFGALGAAGFGAAGLRAAGFRAAQFKFPCSIIAGPRSGLRACGLQVFVAAGFVELRAQGLRFGGLQV